MLNNLRFRSPNCFTVPFKAENLSNLYNLNAAAAAAATAFSAAAAATTAGFECDA